MAVVYLSQAAQAALIRFDRAVQARETATQVSKQAHAASELAYKICDEKQRSFEQAEKHLDDTQTEYEAATAELTRALGGTAFDPTSGDLI